MKSQVIKRQIKLELKNKEFICLEVIEKSGDIIGKISFKWQNEIITVRIFGGTGFSEHNPPHIHVKFKNLFFRVNIQSLNFLCLNPKTNKVHCDKIELKNISKL